MSSVLNQSLQLGERHLQNAFRGCHSDELKVTPSRETDFVKWEIDIVADKIKKDDCWHTSGHTLLTMTTNKRKVAFKIFQHQKSNF